MSATVTQPTRPDTSDLYQFVWFTDSGLPVECFFDYAPPDHDDEIIPSAPAKDPGMSLKHAFVCGTHDFADKLTYHVIQEMERMALLDYLHKDSAKRNKMFGTFLPPSRDYHSFASFLG